MNQLELIKEKYKKSFSRNFDKFLEQNYDIRIYLEKILEEEKWFQTTKNIFIALNHNVTTMVTCLNCKKPLNVNKAIYGRNKYCCKKCSDTSILRQELKKESNLKKYGCQTPLLNEQCKKKTIQTCRKKFNNDMFAGSVQFAKRIKTPFLKEEVQNKSLQTKKERYGENFGKVLFQRHREQVEKRNTEKYGVPYLLLNNQIKQKTHDSIEEKYGKRYFFGTEECVQIKFQCGWKTILTWKEYVEPMFTRQQYLGRNKEYKWKCVHCGNEFKSRIYNTDIGECGYIPRCLNCYPIFVSFPQKQVLQFVEQIYKGQIINNDRTIIKPYQIDIYLPQLRLGIQFDGLFWHSEKCNKKQFNLLNKTNLCKQKGINLIHIFQDQWIYKQEETKEKLKRFIDNDFQNEENIVQIDLRYDNSEFYLDKGYQLLKQLKPKKYFIKGQSRVDYQTDNYIYDCGKLVLIKN